MPTRKTWLFVVLVLAVLAFTGAVPVARADSFTSVISTPNTAISGFTGPYVNVVVDLVTPTFAQITFTSDSAGGNIYLMGDGGSADLNVNAAAFSPLTIIGSNSGTGFSPGPFSNGGAGTVDGFGSFNLTINSFDGFTHSSDSITINLVNTSGTWSSAADVLTPNADGFDAAAHVFVTSAPANASNGALATGFAAEGAAVPEPSTLMMLGSGLLALGGIFRRIGG